VASGLFALLDDVAAIAKVAAASVDDIALQSVKGGTKAAGIVIDDTAVTPRYVVGFASKRELPIIWKISLGSLRNKLLILLPGALVLSSFAPWAITPLLIFGALFLCFEGYEKIHSLITGHEHDGDHGEKESADQSPEEMEAEMVTAAIRTDFILSAEIMAITLATVADQTLVMRAIVLAVVGLGITMLVYGLVALIVKADDAGVALVRTRMPVIEQLGWGLVKGMPFLLSILSVVGTLAMLWVGGDIVLHGIAHFGLDAPEHWIKETAGAIGAAMPLSAFVTWLVGATFSGIVGAVLGAAVVPVVAYVIKPLMASIRGKQAAGH
jgi:predicted DNA repair protein MutK